MKERALRDAALCAVCRNLIGECGLPMFWRVTIERHGVKMDALKRQDGLAQFLGSPALAAEMGADEDMTEPLMEPRTVSICEWCGTSRPVAIAELALGEDRP